MAHTQGFSKNLFISLEREEIIELKGRGEIEVEEKKREDELGKQEEGGWGSLSGIKSGEEVCSEKQTSTCKRDQGSPSTDTAVRALTFLLLLE